MTLRFMREKEFKKPNKIFAIGFLAIFVFFMMIIVFGLALSFYYYYPEQGFFISIFTGLTLFVIGFWIHKGYRESRENML